MIAEYFTAAASRRAFERALQAVAGPATSPAGEERIVFSGVTWEQYERLDTELGHDRPAPRLCWFDSQLELMTTSRKHEEIKEWLGTLIEDYLYEVGVEAFLHGQATLKSSGEVAAEPDKSWCLGHEKEVPDLVLEVALSSGGIPKPEVYQRLGVPEVWLWRKGALEVWSLRPDRSGCDGPVRSSRLLPGLDLGLLEHCVTLPSWREARTTFRRSLRKS